MGLSSALRRVSGASDRAFPWAAPTWPGTLSRPAPKRRIGVDYPTDWARKYPFRLLRAAVLDNVTRPVAHLIAAPEVRGAEILELVEPPAVFVANHSSHVDTPLLLSVLPTRFRHKTVVAAAADHFFDRKWKAHLWAVALAAIPIERHRVNRRSADLASELLAEGWNLVVYPEGGRSPDGWFQPFRGGAAYLAVRTGRPVVPVHIEGTYEVLSKDGGRLRRRPTTLIFGAPLVAGEGEDARHLASRIETALAVLADESKTDFWSAKLRAASRTTPSPGGPQAAAWRRAWALRGPRFGPDSDRAQWAARDRAWNRWRMTRPRTS